MTRHRAAICSPSGIDRAISRVLGPILPGIRTVDGSPFGTDRRTVDSSPFGTDRDVDSSGMLDEASVGRS